LTYFRLRDTLSAPIILTGTAGVIASAIANALGLFLIGAAITLMTGRNAFFSGLRMVGFGLPRPRSGSA
jgi:hypothetical protein